MKHFPIYLFFASAIFFYPDLHAKIYNLLEYGIEPDVQENTTIALDHAIMQIIGLHKDNSPIVLQFSEGTYNFYPVKELKRTYYISNHDQDNPKNIGIAMEKLENIVFDGQDAHFVFHGRMLPLSIIDCKNCIFENFSIDFDNPHITQLKVVANDTVNHQLTFEVPDWVNYRIENGVFIACGEGWEHTPLSCIAFDGDTKHILFNTSDLNVNFNEVRQIGPRIIVANDWDQPRLVPGTVIACRSWHRPTPGIFIHNSRNIRFTNVKVHYAEGMGLLAQLCENITLDKFAVCLKDDGDPRYFTTQADATHFSACRGKIISVNGFYEGMMDDAINVHGTYLKITGRLNDNTLTATYMHHQSWGFTWGHPGDVVQFIRSSTMEKTGSCNTIASISPMDQKTDEGTKQFEITFTSPLPSEISANEKIGIENLTWTPKVKFSHNIIRNNRARGALFSTPRKTIVKQNLFDHTSGTAILLCGDCNGWYESGACREVIIRHNTFINALTNMFQFTNAIISICPEIPEMEKQAEFFHGRKGRAGIIVKRNLFETFDKPILYAKSTQGLVFSRNKISHNEDFPAFHWNTHPFLFEKTVGIKVRSNHFDTPFDAGQDIVHLD